MQFDQHGNGNGLDDLYVLPETPEEGAKIRAFLKERGKSFQNSYSDVEGQPWHGKTFIEIPFGEHLKEEIRAIK